MNDDPTKTPEAHKQAVERVQGLVRTYLDEGILSEKEIMQSVTDDGAPNTVSLSCYVENGDSVYALRSDINRTTGEQIAIFIEDVSMRPKELLLGQAVFIDEAGVPSIFDRTHARTDKPVASKADVVTETEGRLLGQGRAAELATVLEQATVMTNELRQAYDARRNELRRQELQPVKVNKIHRRARDLGAAATRLTEKVITLA